MKKSFREFIAEDESSLIDQKFERFVQDCSTFFKFWADMPYNRVLYRGDRDKTGINEFEATDRTIDAPKFEKYDPTKIVKSGRFPKDTHPKVHNVVNEVFIELFGYPFRDGVMATGSQSEARSYEPFIPNTAKSASIFIPANGFVVCYSPSVGDFYGDIVEEYNLPDQQLEIEDEDEFKELVKNIIVEDGKYVEGEEHLPDAIDSHNEVMFYPKDGQTLRYYLFSEDFWYEEVLPRLKKTFHK